MKLLMHMCCASCAAEPVSILKEKGIETDGLYFKECLQQSKVSKSYEDKIIKLSKNQDVNVFIYPEVSDKLILEEACFDTHEVRIKKTFELGKELGYDAVSTSLLVSPKLDHDYILSVGHKYSESFDIPFYYEAFMLDKK